MQILYKHLQSRMHIHTSAVERGSGESLNSIIGC